MKLKIFFLLVCVHLLHSSFAQNCEGQQAVCDNSAWDWEQMDCRMWLGQLSQEQNAPKVLLPSPFHSNTLPPKLAEIKRLRDYTRDKGWRLVVRDFGCGTGLVNPYFVLYNKYLGILRVFVYNQSTGDGYLTGYVMRLKIEGSQKVSGFTAGGRFPSYTSERYLNNDFDEGDNPASHQLLYVGAGFEAYRNNWLVADFRPDLDVNITHADYRDSEFTITVFGVIESTLKAKISPDDPDDLAKKDDIVIASKNGGSHAGDDPSVLEIVSEKSGTVLGYYAKGTEQLERFMKSKLGGIIDRNVTDGSVKKLQDLLSAQKLKDIVDIASDVHIAVGIAASVFSVVGDMLGIFDDGSGAVATQAAISQTTMFVSGTLRAEAGLVPIQIRVPGVFKSEDHSNTPFYDCTYGIAGLSYAPAVQVQSFFWENAPGSGTKHYRSYRVNNNVNFKLNAETGNSNVLVKAALGAEIPLAWATDGNRPVGMQIEQGRLRIVDVAEKGGGQSGEPRKERMLVHTVPVDLKYIKGASLQLPVSSDPTNVRLFLRVYAVMDNPVSSIPVYFIKDYAVKTDTLSTELSIPFDTQLPPFANYTEIFFSHSLDGGTASKIPLDDFDWDDAPQETTVGANRQLTSSAELRNYYEFYHPVNPGGPSGVKPYNGTITLMAGEVILKNGFKTTISPSYTTPDVTFHIKSDGAFVPQTGNSVVTTYTPALCVDPEIDASQISASASLHIADTEPTIAFEVESGTRIWPNPVYDVLNVQMPVAGEITILDFSGNIVMTAGADEPGGISLNVSSLKKGQYILNYRHAYGETSRQFVVNR